MSNTAGAVVAAKRMQAERQMIEALKAAEAFSPDKAIPLAPDRNLARLALRGLLRQNAVRQAQAGFYYLDEPVYAAIRKNRQRMLIGVGVIAVVFLGAIAIATSSDAQVPAPTASTTASASALSNEGSDLLIEVVKRYPAPGG